jgi:hypothetical protein
MNTCVVSATLQVLLELFRNGGCTEVDAPRVLDLLLSMVPHYLTKTHAVDGRGAMIRIARNINSNTVRAQIQSLCSGQCGQRDEFKLL